ncbi:MAG: type II secretion system F family protein [Candidatus Aenigmarchaeota archaeon]|nr:type II secretion system F family protein [Candidatus Aenigmarchaeota archaeon]
MYDYVAKILPRRIRHNYEDLLRYIDAKVDPAKFIGFIMLFGLGVALATAFNAMILFSMAADTFMVLFFTSYFLFEITVYFWLSFSADSKGKFVENILPDALLLMSMNMKAGITTERALLMAARPEFGPLEKELSKAGKQVLSGKEIKYALLEIPRRIKSEVLDRTVRLIVEGIESGGELSDLLEQTAEDIQNTKLVKGEVQANVLMYGIFIFFAAGFGAPLLFGISTFLVEVLTRQMSQFNLAETGIQGINIARGTLAVTPEFDGKRKA